MTARVVTEWAARMLVPLRHIWHPDRGFRLAEIRNRAIRASAGTYCVFLDGDCIARPDFVAAHRRLAEPGCFVTGNRILLSRELTERILFLCTRNSARSQMAEGLLRSLGSDRFEALSAGTEATQVRPLAIRAMAELGIDISGHESKTLDRYLDQRFDKVITVCDDANEACPVFFGARERLHWSFPDPSKAIGTNEDQLGVYRQVRDAIRVRIEQELLRAPPTT